MGVAVLPVDPRIDASRRQRRASDPQASAWVEANGLDLVITSLRTQVFHPEGFTKLGVDLQRCKIVVVKSTQHFHAGFYPIARAILYAGGPGALHPDYAKVPYTKLSRPYWPRVENPFAG